jgi:hypothetical protein
MNAQTKKIMQTLAKAFAPLDAEVLKASKVWAAGRVQALRDFRESEEYQSLRSNQHAVYERMFEIAGGKSWYSLFQGRAQAEIDQLVAKNCEQVVAKRNASIAAKLDKAGVKGVEGEVIATTADGFNGHFTIDTDAGKKAVTIETIRAGGYNIQCLHLRVLVKIR